MKKYIGSYWLMNPKAPQSGYPRSFGIWAEDIEDLKRKLRSLVGSNNYGFTIEKVES